VSTTPCGRPHQPRPPQIDAAEPTDRLPDEGDEDLRNLWLRDARVLGLDLDRPELLDLRLTDCDLSGVVASGFVARRVELSGTRIRGVTFVKGQYDDGLVTDCTTSELSLRFSKLRHVVFRNCDLSGADFYNVTFEHVTIDGCDLQRATFDTAHVKCLSITNCNLVAVRGINGLKGARVDASDLPGMAPALASEAGILIRDA
jgi:uncharacterized protein YjbI with pentapeptide repeats